MNLKIMKRGSAVRSAATVAAGLTILAAGTRAAWADIKVIAQETTKGQAGMMSMMGGGPPGAPKKEAEPTGPVTVTTYYKGNRQRIERGGDVTITDFNAGKILTLNVAKKTYTELSLTDLGANLDTNPMLKMFKVNASADVKPGGETKAIAGRPSKNYKYTLTFKMEATDPQMAAFLSGLTTTVTGEQWVTETLTIPTDATSLARNKMLKQLPVSVKDLEQVGAQMGIMKGFPLSSITTVKIDLPEQLKAMMASQGGGKTNEPIVSVTEVTSISEDPLDDALFTVPAGYKKVEAPRPKAPPLGAPGGADE